VNTYEKGFSLLEVLITLFILSLGLLGIASLETVSLRRNYAAYLHSVASTKVASNFERGEVKEHGFTLVEILIAISLGLILMAGIAQVYLSVKKSHQTEQNMARLQENGRFATMLLMRNIRMAGYGGCLSSNLKDGVQVFHGSNLPSYLQGKVASGTDVIVIKKADTNVTHLTEDVDAPTNTIKVEHNPATKTNPESFISDCKHSDKFTATSFGEKNITANKELANYKKPDTEVASFTEIAYFIGKTAYGLYSITNKGRSEELIAGINDMQIKYGGNNVSIILTLAAGGKKTIKWPIFIALRERTAARY
jgi:prepilin-type N-terminal cleavage/methylation domain-containing protein